MKVGGKPAESCEKFSYRICKIYIQYAFVKVNLVCPVYI